MERTARYICALAALLKGEAAQLDSGLAQVLRIVGFGAPRPVDVPIAVAA
jgi:5,10-methylenetetrahydromethanopterin reductase